MAAYREVVVELRFDGHEWRLAGVVIDDEWHPAARGIARPDNRLVESGLVRLLVLPTFIAGSLRGAIRTATWLCRERGIGLDEPGATQSRARLRVTSP